MEGTVLRGFFFFFCQQEKKKKPSEKSEVIAQIKEGICYCLVFVQSCDRIQRRNADKKHRFYLDNLPIHSAKCSCYEYDGVLLLIIIITVMVIINNYLMM